MSTWVLTLNLWASGNLTELRTPRLVFLGQCLSKLVLSMALKLSVFIHGHPVGSWIWIDLIAWLDPFLSCFIFRLDFEITTRYLDEIWILRHVPFFRGEFLQDSPRCHFDLLNRAEPSSGLLIVAIHILLSWWALALSASIKPIDYLEAINVLWRGYSALVNLISEHLQKSSVLVDDHRLGDLWHACSQLDLTWSLVEFWSVWLVVRGAHSLEMLLLVWLSLELFHGDALELSVHFHSFDTK